MLNIVLFGAPGAGKGTQATLLAAEFGLMHLSTGDMLRMEIAAGTELGMRAQRFIDRGEFVSDETVINMIREQIDRSLDAKGFIFDGFPRTVAQAETLDALMSEKAMRIALVAALDVETEELVKRLHKRGESSGRADDRSMDVIRNRIDVYHLKTEPVIDYYRARGKYCPVDGAGNIADIFNRLRRCVENIPTCFKQCNL
jgi:adenylate kinase